MEPKFPHDTHKKDKIDLFAASKTILRVVANWQQTEYTDSNSIQNERQDDVLTHTDLPNPASAEDTMQG